jgi:hypothetical protein
MSNISSRAPELLHTDFFRFLGIYEMMGTLCCDHTWIYNLILAPGEFSQVYPDLLIKIREFIGNFIDAVVKLGRGTCFSIIILLCDFMLFPESSLVDIPTAHFVRLLPSI